VPKYNNFMNFLVKKDRLVKRKSNLTILNSVGKIYRLQNFVMTDPLTIFSNFLLILLTKPLHFQIILVRYRYLKNYKS
jgi:hypothetical protein